MVRMSIRHAFETTTILGIIVEKDLHVLEASLACFWEQKPYILSELNRRNAKMTTYK